MFFAASAQFLDPVSEALLDAKMQANPDLPYQTFWDELRVKFLRNIQALRWRNWQQVRLVKAGERPTLQEWTLVQETYIHRRNLVDNWSEHEDRRLVFRALDKHHIEKIKEETACRRKGHKWVKLSHSGVHPTLEVLDDFQKTLGVQFQVIKIDQTGALINFENDQDRVKFLAWDQGTFMGELVRVLPTEYLMSGDDMLNFIRDLLALDEEMELLLDCYSLPQQQDRKEHHVSHASGEKSKGKEKPKNAPKQYSSQNLPRSEDGWKTVHKKRAQQGQWKTWSRWFI